jgi:hypothetical protein
VGSAVILASNGSFYFVNHAFYEIDWCGSESIFARQGRAKTPFLRLGEASEKPSRKDILRAALAVRSLAFRCSLPIRSSTEPPSHITTPIIHPHMTLVLSVTAFTSPRQPETDTTVPGSGSRRSSHVEEQGSQHFSLVHAIEPGGVEPGKSLKEIAAVSNVTV